MSDIYGEKFGVKQEEAAPAARVSYTLNNHQPVISTIIGDEPLFYMDFDISAEDEALFNETELDLLEREAKTLRRNVDAFDTSSDGSTQETEVKIEEFQSDCLFMTGKEAASQEISIKDITETLSHSRLAVAYLEHASEHKVEIAHSTQTQTAQYDRRAGKIFINPSIELTDQILLAARELRRHWQHRQGALIHPLMFHPDNAVLINRAQVADLAGSMIRIGWELQLAGIKNVWERIEQSTMSDLARAFSREALMDFRTINNGNAHAAVFEAWFLSERCRAEDRNLVQQMLSDYQGYVFDLEEATKSITPNLIAALGEMPYGKNYLAHHAQAIMNDTVFTDVRDRSNANFLWFIKFERSFRETEQELQTNTGLDAGKGPLAVTSQKEQDADYAAQEQQNAGEIVTLYTERDNAEQASKQTGTDGSASADIVYLRAWSGD